MGPQLLLKECGYLQLELHSRHEMTCHGEIYLAVKASALYAGEARSRDMLQSEAFLALFPTPRGWRRLCAPSCLRSSPALGYC